MGIYSEPDLYCAAFGAPTDAEVDLVMGLVDEPTSLLEPFCGHARAARAFVDRGLSYTGFDLSVAMVMAAFNGKGVHVHAADARDFDLPARPRGGFDLAWCPNNSLCHLGTNEEIISHLRSMERHVADSGAYAVELEIFDREGSTDDARWEVDMPGGGTLEASWSCGACDRDVRTRQETGAFRHVVDGRVIAETVERFAMRMWTFQDLVELTSASGWTLDRVCYRQCASGPTIQSALDRDVENSGFNWTFVLRPARARSLSRR